MSLQEATRTYACTSCEELWQVIYTEVIPSRCPICKTAKWPMLSDLKEDAEYAMQLLEHRRAPEEHTHPDRLF